MSLLLKEMHKSKDSYSPSKTHRNYFRIMLWYQRSPCHSIPDLQRADNGIRAGTYFIIFCGLAQVSPL